MQMILDNRNLELKYKKNCFWISRGETNRLIHPKYVTSILVTANCMISKSAIELALKNKITIFFSNSQTQKIKGMVWGPNMNSLSQNIRKQIEFSESTAAFDWVIENICLKINEQKNRVSNHTDFKKELQQLENIISGLKAIPPTENLSSIRASLMGYEGAASKIYWKWYASLFEKEWRFRRRQPKPAIDSINVLLNYLYGMTYTQIIRYIFTVGLDPYFGLFHAEQYKKPILAFDIIEPFRPFIDGIIVDLIVGKQISMYNFSSTASLTKITKQSKRIIIDEFHRALEKEIKFDGIQNTLKNAMLQYTSLLKDKILKPKIDEDE